ncbi:MAG TPA: hypothetical protein VK050_11220 [Flavobacteriaceae bacterium]|nr:hypothetical protein [Flavobacteriaceae bacterium]
MNINLKIKSVVPKILMLTSIVLFLGSCTVYKYPERASEDGIYSTRTYRGQADGYTETNNYYKQYFHSKQGTYSELLTDQEESAIFTDIEAYSTREYIGDDGYVYSERVSTQDESYAGWGNNTTSVNINLYGGYGYGYGGYYNSFYGVWGYPYYGYGYYYPRWRGGFSWWYGWNGFYSPFYYYHPSYYYGHSHYYRPYYNYVSYNRGRRNNDYNGRTAARGRTSAINAARGRSTLGAEARRGTNNTVSRRSATTNNNIRRSSPTNTNVRRSNNQTMRREATSPARRVTFPQQSNRVRVTPSTQPSRRQSPVNNRVRSNPTPKSPVKTNSPTRRSNRSSGFRSPSPSRSSAPAMRSSSPSRSSAPASRGRSGGRR